MPTGTCRPFVITLPPYLSSDSILDLIYETKQLESGKYTTLVFQGTCSGLSPQIVNTTRKEISESLDQFISWMCTLYTLNYPIISLITGDVMGGGVGIAALSDIVLVTPNASFMLPEGRIGLTPGLILPALSQRLSLHTIKHMVLTSARVPASEAQQIGLIDKIVPEPSLNTEMQQYALTLEKCHTESFKALKKLTHNEEAFRHKMKQGAMVLLELLDSPKVQQNLSILSNYREVSQ